MGAQSGVMDIVAGNMTETECLQTITSSTLVNRRELLFVWAGQVGASAMGNEGELDLLKKITKAKGVPGSVGNFSETDCLRVIAVFDHAVVTSGSLSAIECLKALAKASTAGSSDPTPPVVANANVNAAGTLLTINWTETGSPPVIGTTGLSLAGMTHGAATLSGVTTAGTQTTATISRAITNDETITLSYTPGNFTDSATPPNAAAGFNGQAVTNSSAQDYIPSLLNAQKLSLPANTPVGTRVQVTDGFAVSGNSYPSIDGFVRQIGTSNGKAKYANFGSGDFQIFVEWVDYLGNGLGWYFYNGNDGAGYFSDEDVAEPWLVTVWEERNFSGAITLTPPAVQELTAPSTAQGGVFVPEFGIFTKRGMSNGKDYFKLLGTPDDNDTLGEVVWYASLGDVGLTVPGAGWVVHDIDGNSNYYSTSAVATPDLVPNTSGAGGWKNSFDDSPASIVVTSLTVGQIAAGLKVGSTFYAATTSTNWRNGYHDVLGVAADYTFDGTKWTNGTTNGSGNTAFPWDGGIGTRDDVCSETNWEVSP